MALNALWDTRIKGHIPLGESVTDGIECIVGSAMYLKSTGISLKTPIHLTLAQEIILYRFVVNNIVKLSG